MAANTKTTLLIEKETITHRVVCSKTNGTFLNFPVFIYLQILSNYGSLLMQLSPRVLPPPLLYKRNALHLLATIISL